MAFTESEVSEYLAQIETVIWSKRRPPLALRDQIREGQRITGHTVDLFVVRPRYSNPAEMIECEVARARYVRTQNVWKVYWKRGNGKWCEYEPSPVKTFKTFLQLVQSDSHGCFWG